jgi:hypothetical protein
MVDEPSFLKLIDWILIKDIFTYISQLRSVDNPDIFLVLNAIHLELVGAVDDILTIIW